MPAPGRFPARAAPAALCVLVVAAYANSLAGAFVFDDQPAILQNPSIRRLWPLWKVCFPPALDGSTVEGRPLLNLSLAVNYAIGGVEPRGYHLFNVGVHLLAVLTLYGLVRRTLLLPRWREKYAERAAGLALAVAALWGVHPLLTQSVTYIVQRAESLMGLCYLTTLYAIVRSVGSDSPRRWQTAAVACCAAGMATKEVMVSVPLVALLYDRVLISRSFREALSARRGLYAGLAMTWLLLAALVWQSGGRGKSAGFGAGVTPWQYAVTQLPAITHYLRLCFWPDPLIFDYGQELVTPSWRLWPYAAFVVFLIGATLLAWRRQAWIGFLGTAFFAILAPSSSIVPIVTQTMSEHRMYLPLVCVVILTVMAAEASWRRVVPALLKSNATRRLAAIAPISLLAALVVLLAVRTHLRNTDYYSAASLWADNVIKRPQNFRGYLNLGSVQITDDPQTALRLIQHAIELRPDFAQSYNARGRTEFRLGRLDDALASFSEAIRLAPDRSAAGYVNRAIVHESRQEFDEALADYDTAQREWPQYEETYRHRARLHLRRQEIDAARQDVEMLRSLGFEPDADILRGLRGAKPQAE